MCNINLKCHNFLNVSASKQYNLSKFTFENINVETTKKVSTELDYKENQNNEEDFSFNTMCISL